MLKGTNGLGSLVLYSQNSQRGEGGVGVPARDCLANEVEYLLVV